MVKALYPQKWLPHHYLGGLAFDKWDALAAMRDVVEGTLLARLREDMLVLLSQKDEIVPNEMGQLLYEAASLSPSEPGTATSLRRMVVIPGALHDSAWTVRRWRGEFEGYVQAIASKKGV